MLTVNTNTLHLADIWLEGDPDHARVRVNFPLNRAAGTDDSAVVYFEVQPGDRLGRHTDSAEEILYIVSGSAEAEVGGERGIVSAGDLAVIPAMVPHALRTIGDEPVKVVGFFSEAVISSRFEDRLQPIDSQEVDEMVPIPAEVPA
jgi:quercetin dioxygenase-like cupin family protein